MFRRSATVARRAAVASPLRGTPALAALASLLLAVWSSDALVAQPTGASARTSVLAGVVLDVTGDTPIADAIVALRRGDAVLAAVRTDSAGRFTFRLPARAGADSTAVRLELDVRRLGFASRRVPVGREPSVRIGLVPLASSLDAVRVTTRALGDLGAWQATAVVDAETIAERMAASVAALVAAEPGVTVRSNGPMATQPIIRGLGGDRVLVLEDGMRTGDIASTAPDHAVTIDPATARRVEVVRGPGGLLYGSNTLGGVVNVVRDDIPLDDITRTDWRVATFGESVNGGTGLSARARGTTGAVGWQADIGSRRAGDTRAPGGALPFTDLEGFDAGAGAAWRASSGHVGAAVREFRSFYGVPASFGGVTLPGAHAGGVYVDVHRTTARADAAWRPRKGPVREISAGANAVRFEQEELELGGFVGTRFGQLMASGEVVARLEGGAHRGAIGAFAQWRDLRAEGSFTGTRPAVQQTFALFAVDEWSLGRIALLGGARLDLVRATPLDTTETQLLRNVRERRFGAVTGALGIRAPLGAGFTGSLQVARAFRPPAIEELYSAGPHLANYAYEVGRPDLGAETGVGVDAVLRWRGERASAEVSAFSMALDDFITFAPQLDSVTGRPLRDPRLRRYVVYRPQQGAARLRGGELRATWVPDAHWLLDVRADVVDGRTAAGDGLPAMPPASARLEVRRTASRWSAGVHLEAFGAQRNLPPAPDDPTLSCRVTVEDGEALALPAEFCRTPGAALVGVTARRRIESLRWPVTATLAVDNLLDATWRDPLWRAKLVAPQPGRNVRLMLEVTP